MLLFVGYIKMKWALTLVIYTSVNLYQYIVVDLLYNFVYRVSQSPCSSTINDEYIQRVPVN
jgi:hypothetical protein